MRIRVLLAIMVLATWGLSGCRSMEESVVSALLSNYVTAQEALASDDLDQARNAFVDLAESSDGEVREVARVAAEAKDIKQARAHFRALSDKVAKLGLPKGYVLAHCPMANEGKGADWVQKDGEIANPYFGSEMQSCGTIEKKGQE